MATTRVVCGADVMGGRLFITTTLGLRTCDRTDSTVLMNTKIASEKSRIAARGVKKHCDDSNSRHRSFSTVTAPDTFLRRRILSTLFLFSRERLE